MRRLTIGILLMVNGGCMAPLLLDTAAGDCATVRIQGETAMTYQCGAPPRRQRCVDEGAPTVLPYAGAYRTIRCSPQDDLGLASR